MGLGWSCRLFHKFNICVCFCSGFIGGFRAEQMRPLGLVQLNDGQG